MPELPEVETVMRGLRPVMEGRRFERVAVRRPNLRFALKPDLAQRLEGRQVSTLERRAKYIWITLDDGQILFFHLGMSGRMTIHGKDELPEPGKHDHILFDMSGENGFENQVRFCDPRRFGMMDIADDRAALLRDRAFARLGPEPLGNAFNGPALIEIFRGRKAPLKAALLDQRNIAGLGNIYVCEALNLSGLSPLRPAGTLSADEADRLASAVRQTLEQAIEAGGSSLRDYVQASGELGYFQHQWRVYGKEGEACPACGERAGDKALIQRIQQSGRSTFWCENCQH
ncbi:bifunctional DNA-formamidopyrimidine glycosylase/DNA-(apurinic or apyrimidinic site) lyase [Kiloniella sp. b19]|uniref:bifunctional DNA-formamidopyrimidine glycosylase/DNA-(apurinic or apyrimidinic site) lyase n=1 Tax=Kiloniella sp. GXU_MW_B19 TaxID=3141326 RepID=UPI0031D368D2